jgi:olefin beta-lactone synthetase
MNSVETVNVAIHLATLAASEPQRLAVVCPHARGRTELTFQQLHDQSDHLAHGLERVGVKRGVRTALMVPPCLEFFTLTFALFKTGAVPVLIDPGMGVRNLGRCLADAEPEAFIGVLRAHLARKLLGWARSTIQVTVTTGRWFANHTTEKLLEEGEKHGAFPQAATAASDTAAILFTSGSTGIAKGVLYTHGIFAAQVDLLRRMYRIEPGEVDLSTFPLFALFGPALGMTAVVPNMDPTRPANVDPVKIIDAVRRFRVTNLFGSPALIDRVGRFGEEKSIKLPTLRRVISAGAPVPAKVIERFAAMLTDGAQVHTPYGATESLPVSSIGSDKLLRETRQATERGCGVCVGHPVDGMRVRIIPISDEPIKQWDESRCLGRGEIGEIAVSGPVVTTTYFNRPEATELAKIRDLQTGQWWHRMGDVGYLDSEGRLWFCGRKSQRVVTARGTLFTIPCEAVFNTHPYVHRSALVGVAADGAVHPVICVELERDKISRWSDRQGDLMEIAKRHGHTRSIAQVLFHPGFPVDVRHNAKIFREKLAVWAAKKLKGHRWPQADEPILRPPTVDSLMQTEGGERA